MSQASSEEVVLFPSPSSPATNQLASGVQTPTMSLSASTELVLQARHVQKFEDDIPCCASFTMTTASYDDDDLDGCVPVRKSAKKSDGCCCNCQREFSVISTSNSVDDFCDDGSPEDIKFPFRMNRQLLLLLAVIMTVCLGSLFADWRSTDRLLNYTTSYSRLCPNAASSDYPEYCIPSAASAVESLLLQLRSSALLTSVVVALISGVAVDSFGPRQAIVVGLLTQAVGWVLLSQTGSTPDHLLAAFSSSSADISPSFVSNSGRVLALMSAVLISGGGEPIYLGVLKTAVELFPNRRCLAVAIVSSAHALARILPTLLHSLLVSFSEFLTLEIVALSQSAIQLLWLVVMAVFVPRWDNLSFPSTSVSQTHGDAEAFGYKRSRRSARLSTVQPRLSQCAACGAENPRSSLSQSTIATFSQQQLPSPRICDDGSSNEVSRQQQQQRRLGENSCDHAAVMVSSKQHGDALPIIEEIELPTRTQLFKEIAAALFQLRFLCLLIAAVAAATAVALPLASSSSSADRLLLLSQLSHFSFILVPLIGLAFDRWDALHPETLLLIFGFLALAQLALLSLFPASLFAKIGGAVLHVILVGAATPQFYCFVSLMFPSKCFGSLAGALSSTASLATFAIVSLAPANSTTSLSTGVQDNILTHAVNISCLGIAAVNLGTLSLIWVRSRREADDANDCDGVKQAAGEASVSRFSADRAFRSSDVIL